MRSGDRASTMRASKAEGGAPRRPGLRIPCLRRSSERKYSTASTRTVHGDAALKNAVERTEGRSRVSGGAETEQLVQRVHAHEAELVADESCAELALGECAHLVEKGIGIAERAAGFLGDPEKGVVFGLDSYFLGRLGQEILDDIDGDEAKGELLAAAFYGGRNLVELGRREDEHDVGRRLLDGLEQRVERAVREHVHLVDDIDLVASAVGRKEDLVLDLPDVVDRGIGGPVDLDNVEAGARAISTQERHVPQGLAVGPCSQFRALATMRAVLVLPQPRGPEKR